jgi:serine protease inhibitor
MLTSPQSTSVQATMPKFGYDFELRLNDILIALGLSDAFNASKANLSKTINWNYWKPESVTGD